MIFLELALQNFGPYQGRQVINLRPETNNSTHPIILFGGMNGGGKTTLMDAIRLTLYGSRAQCSTRGNLSYNDFLNQCVNRNTPPTEKTRIELAFEIVEEDKPRTLRIVRYWTKDPKDGKDTLGILVDEEWPDKALANTWDDYIENLLPLGISNLFLFDGEQVKELAELETPPPLVVSAIQSLLGLELAERLSTDLDILASRKRRDIANQKELETLDNIEAKLIDQKEKQEAATQDLSALKSKLDYAAKEQQVASDKFVSEGGKLASERSQLEAQSETLIEQANQVRQEMRELAAGVLPLSLISPLLEQAKAQAEQEQKQHQVKLTREVLKERDARLIQYIKKISLTPKRVNQIQSFLESDNQELDQEIAAQEEPWLLADEAAITRLETLLNYELSTAQTNAQSQRERLQTLEMDIDALERQIATAASPEAYNALKQAFTDAQNQVIKVKAAYENASRRYDEIDRQIRETKKELETYADETIKLKNNQHIINSIAKVKTTLELFREKLTLKKLNKLEIEVTECFRYLLHKSDLVHRVAIDTQSFSLSLYDPEGQPIPKHRLSAGEKQLLAISFLWGLARVSGRHLPVAIDTPLGRLDSSHRSNLVERYFPTASHQVILLSTDTEIRETEVKRLRELDAIAQEYCLNYDPKERQTIVEPGYFW
ncbi:MAG: DNA sulfur modification protein DndD [Coleofasciculus sp. C1-SOL-03]|jgi:DNA sulfur modification protein DndD|uniref:DNA sulfur modification protein DndD n=1 Tax=Coleofasciculus sp. C1-SOL-03 TaxID=3069522 RepID=UPI0033014EE6